MNETAKRKGGRPSKDPTGGKRPTLTFRCRETLQDALKAAAQAADRSISEEVELRIARSFAEPELAERLADVVDRAFARRDGLAEPIGSPPPAYAQ